MKSTFSRTLFILQQSWKMNFTKTEFRFITENPGIENKSNMQPKTNHNNCC